MIRIFDLQSRCPILDASVLFNFSSVMLAYDPSLPKIILASFVLVRSGYCRHSNS